MSLGQLGSWPPGGNVTVVLSRSPDADLVMSEICESAGPTNEKPPERHKQEFDRLRRAGALVLVPNATPILVIEDAGTSSHELSSFTFRRGPLRGKPGWACPSAVKLYHAFP